MSNHKNVAQKNAREALIAIKRAASAFHRQYPWIDVTDFEHAGLSVFANACSKYESNSDVPFLKFFHVCLRNGLRNEIRTHTQTEDISEMTNLCVSPWRAKESLEYLMETMSDTAKAAVDMLFSMSDNGDIDDMAPKKIRGKLRHALMENGWPERKVNKTIRELKELVR